MHKPAATLLLCVSSFAAACASTEAHAPANPPRPAVAMAVTEPVGTEVASAGDVKGAVEPSMTDDEIAAARAEGPPALEKLFQHYDSMPVGPARDALGAAIDKVAAQRYATVSRMFWYTDLDEAKKAAAAAHKPILSLRMLGRLDEDLSCANSRFFRVVLYANAELSQWLRDNFVLHWSSERAVPRLTIDFGDGRKLERTITGNSVHYVLDSEGHPIDALPGLYAPSIFRRELEDSLVLLGKLEGKSEGERQNSLSDHHRQRLASRLEEWKGMGAIEVPLRGDRLIVPTMAEMGQLRTISKSGREMASLRVVDLGTTPSEIQDDPAAWAQIGLRLFPEAMASKDAEKPAVANVVLTGDSYARSYRIATSPSPVAIPAILDDQSKALIRSMGPRRWGNQRIELSSYATLRVGQGGKEEDEIDQVIATFEREVVADTAKSEFDVRQGIRSLFISGYAYDFATLNQQIYALTFATPATDAWLGLAPGGFMALPHDGVILTSQ